MERLDINWLKMSSNSCKGPEVVRYPHFVTAVNEALDMLKSVDHAGIRGPNTHLNILFHRNDPKLMRGTHGHPQPFTTSRKPDIGVLSLQVARRVYHMWHDTWEDIAKKAAVDPPEDVIEWFEELSRVEKKYEKNIDEPSFRISDVSEMPPPVPPQIDVNMLFTNKRSASSGTQPPSPAAKRQKANCG